jgi:antitoxin MazE
MRVSDRRVYTRGDRRSSRRGQQVAVCGRPAPGPSESPEPRDHDPLYLPQAQQVRLAIFDAVGQWVRRLVDEARPTSQPASPVMRSRGDRGGVESILGLATRHADAYTLCIYMEVRMQTRVQKWGNSLGLRIPKAFAEEAGVGAGSEVNLTVRDGELVIQPVRRRRFRLEDLLRRVTAANLHGEVEMGASVGREVW